MTFNPPSKFNIADYFLVQRMREGRGSRTAIHTDHQTFTYQDIEALSNRFGNALREAGVVSEQRVMVGLPDGPEFVAALFGILKIGAVVVMVNPDLKPDAIRYFYEYTRASAAFIHRDTRATFEEAATDAPHLRALLVVGSQELEDQLNRASDRLEVFPSHRDDAAIWLFSGGTTGGPKAVVQTHTSFANTTECYAKGVIGYAENDITISVPKLYFGYATGSNLLFPFSVGASTVLFPERCTAERLLDLMTTFRPTVLVNVPTMVKNLVNHARENPRDLSCLRLSTSAGEALPPELHARWNDTFGVELLDGLGTAEMWHIFITNRPGEVRPGTLGRVVPGFEVRVCDEEGTELPHGEVGWLWVRGNSRATCYWQHMEKTRWGFRGEWYVSGDMISRDAEGIFTYGGRSDDMLKVSGKWLAIREVETCLGGHPSVREAAVVGVVDEDGLTKPHAFVVAGEVTPTLDDELKTLVLDSLEPYKCPRRITFVPSLPRTHLGKVDRGRLRKM